MPPIPPTDAGTRDLGNLVSDVLGDLAFMVTDAARDDDLTCSPWLAGEVKYRGPVNGSVHCWCSRSFGAQLAANLLGVEPGTPDAQLAAEDALRELLNVLCGQLVTRWHGTDAVFNLSIPTTHETNQSPTDAGLDRHNRHAVLIDGEPVIVAHIAE